MTTFSDRIFAKLQAAGLDVELISASDSMTHFGRDTMVGSALFRLGSCLIRAGHDRGAEHLSVWLGGHDDFALVDVETALGRRSLDWIARVFRNGEADRWDWSIDFVITQLVGVRDQLETELTSPSVEDFKARLREAQRVRMSAWLAGARIQPAPIVHAWRQLKRWASKRLSR